MKNSFTRQLASLLPAWAIAQLVPSALLLAGHSYGLRRFAVLSFLVTNTAQVAHAFRRKEESPNDPAAIEGAEAARRAWRERMLALGLVLLASQAVFLLFSLGFNDPTDWVRPIQAFTTLIPALCLTPFLVLTLRNAFVATVFSLGLVCGTKLVAGTATCLVYGWDAPDQGRTTMPWENPDFLLWVFWIVNVLLAAAFYCLGARRFRSEYSATRNVEARSRLFAPLWSEPQSRPSTQSSARLGANLPKRIFLGSVGLIGVLFGLGLIMPAISMLRQGGGNPSEVEAPLILVGAIFMLGSLVITAKGFIRSRS